MRTTCKMYRFAMTLDRVLPGITDDQGVVHFRCSCRSVKSAENYARKHADILSTNAAPLSCLIEYNTTTGKKTRVLDLTKEA